MAAAMREPEDVVKDAMLVVEQQIDRLKDHSAKRLLEADEARMLKAYGELLLDYATWRKKADEDELEDMDLEQLKEKARELLGGVR